MARITETMKTGRAGRKSAKDPKYQVYIYVEGSVIERMGGMAECKDKLLEFCYRSVK